ncbi:cilia- and flagella-associated protein [Histomonas meleagridis]|uniref:cilia- and flagella-associated protein 70 n=1 Tax=Histomonas meleagridis TaxID=135588 RepID=UPI00355A0A49|nr:cilia- and flagella-associated protein [Histomonas meleagridis]KAH0802172.1 cilia- and flagella-associated protein 70 [Histomonas meleagridis]
MSIEGKLRIGKITGYPASVASRSHCRISISFPQNQFRLTNAISTDDTFDFDYEAQYTLENSNPYLLDRIISQPLKLTLFSVSADTRHQTPAFEFQLYLDSLLLEQKTEISADLIGKHCEKGEFDATITAPTLHIIFQIPEPLISQEDSQGSAILKLTVNDLKNLPNSIISSSLHPDDKIHTFDYNVSFKFPGDRIFQITSGVFNFDDPPFIEWNRSIRVFLPSSSVNALLEQGSKIEFEVWRVLNDEFFHFPITPPITNIFTGRAILDSSEITKPGQSYYTIELSVQKYENEEPIRAPDIALTVDYGESRKSNRTARKIGPKGTKRKGKRPITSKDKKQLKVLQTTFSELTDNDGFNGESKLSIDFQFSHALVLKPLVMLSQLKPSDLCKKIENTCAHKLSDAITEFRETVEILAGEISEAQRTLDECKQAAPDFSDDIITILNNMPSYHIALEKLRNSILYTFSEYSLARNSQSERELKILLSKLPIYLRDEIIKQLPQIYTPTKKPINQREFLIRESNESELIGHKNTAAEYLEELLAIDLNNAESWWIYSCLMYKHGNLRRTEECVRRGLSFDTNHLKLSILFASLLAAQERYVEAINFLNSKKFNEKIVDVVIYILKGLANLPVQQLFDENDSPLSYASELMDIEDVIFSEQLIAHEQILKGETAEVLLKFGQLQYKMHNFPKAISFLTRSISLEKTSDALLLMGHVEYERERFEDAAKWFEQGLELRFEQEAAIRLGFIYLDMDENLKAENILFQCSPQSALVLLGLGIAAVRMEKYKQAEELLNQATVVNYRNPEVWGYIAILSDIMERPDEAMHALEMTKKWRLENPKIIKLLKERFGEEDEDTQIDDY